MPVVIMYVNSLVLWELNIILNTKHTTTKGKNIGTSYLKPIGYYSNAYDVVQRILTLGIMTSNATDIQGIVRTLNECTNSVLRELKA